MHFWIRSNTHTHRSWEAKHVQARLLKVDSDGYTSRKRARIICHDMHLTAGGRQANEAKQRASSSFWSWQQFQTLDFQQLTGGHWSLLTLKRNIFEQDEIELFILVSLTCARGNRKVSDRTPKPRSNSIMHHNKDFAIENWSEDPWPLRQVHSEKWRR